RPNLHASESCNGNTIGNDIPVSVFVYWFLVKVRSRLDLLMRPRSRFTAFVGPFPEGFPSASATGRLSGIQRNWAFASLEIRQRKLRRQQPRRRLVEGQGDGWPRAIGSRCPVCVQ